MCYERRTRYHIILSHEPAHIIEKRVARHRFDLRVRQPAHFPVGLKGRHIPRVNVPVRTRAQEHAARHVRLPKIERLAHDRHRYAEVLRVRRRRNAVRTRADY
jgi:hypothetical protein